MYIRHTGSILKFIGGDHYQDSRLDCRLPFDREQLHTILGAQNVADEFYEQQWHFTAPVFSDTIFTRALPPETILPIIKEKPIDEGGFGNVYAIEIASAHQNLASGLLKHRDVGGSRLIDMIRS